MQCVAHPASNVALLKTDKHNLYYGRHDLPQGPFILPSPRDAVSRMEAKLVERVVQRRRQPAGVPATNHATRRRIASLLKSTRCG